MVDEQSGGGFERRPDVDAAALGALLRRVLGPGLQVARTPAGVAAQVYRVEAAGRVLYARIAEEAHEDLSVDAALLEHLRNQGLHVPAVVHVEPFDQALGRSLLILGEIPGAPLAHCRDQGAARRVARAAGAELAALNAVGVRGFGWVQRRPPPWPLRGSFRDYAGFVGSDLPDPWPGPLAALLPAAEPEAKRLGSRKFGTSAATACPSGEAKAAPIAAASSNQSSETASWAGGDPFGSGSTQFTTNRRSPGSLVTKGRWVSPRCCPKASGLMSARRGRSTITFTTLCLLPVGAPDPPRCLRPGTLRAGGPNPREHPVLPRPAAGTAYPSDGPGVVNARHRLRPGPIRFAIEARCRVVA
jgi:hypothetical protein